MLSVSQSRSPRNSIGEVVAIAIVTVLVVWFFVLPKRADLRTAREEEARQKQALEQSQKEKQQLLTLISQLQSSRTEIVALDEAIPLEARATRLHVLLDSLVSASGMTLVSLEVNTQENIASGKKTDLTDPYAVDRTLQTVTVDLAVSGSIEQFRGLLQALETNSRLIDVTSVDITNEDGVNGYRIKLKSYSYAS